MSNELTGDIELKVEFLGGFTYHDVAQVRDYLASKGLDFTFRIPRKPRDEGVGPKPDSEPEASFVPGRYYVLREAEVGNYGGFLLADMTTGRSFGGAKEMTLTLKSHGKPKLADDPIVTARERALINLGKAAKAGDVGLAQSWAKLLAMLPT